MKKIYLLFLVVGLLPINTVFGQKAYERPTYIDNIYNVQEITAETLMNWDMTGSPIIYGIDLVVSYDVMALRPGTVLVALMSLSNTDNGGLKFEDSYDANLKYIANSTNAYMIAFLNAPHNRYPFINRFPAKSNPLVEDDRSHMQPGLYYHIDVGREKDHIWLAIDGEKIIETVDPDPLGEGHFSFRIRGTAAETASCLIKNVKIYTR